VSDPAGPAPAAAAELFGTRLALAQRYAQRLATAGVERGLLGPREVARLWPRHLMNCAGLADELPVGATVVDVGSGAGLPGLVLAIRRPDLRVRLLEPMLRRVTFLEETVAELGLADTVDVVRGRAEDRAVRATIGPVEWVVARAVAPLERLGGWCLPLLAPGGRLLALKGERAATELAEARPALRRLGAGSATVRQLSEVPGTEPTWVVVVEWDAGRRPREERRGR
jgi:16S rRNA (guanine527-N7)-methyltransferase